MIQLSTVIATIGRRSLDRAIRSVLEQQAPLQFELIVVNDRPQPLPRKAWHTDRRVRILNTNRRERSFARNTGAATARGRYLHFLDDDDYLLPGAWAAMLSLLHDHPGHACYHGATLLVDRENRPLMTLQPQFQGNVFVQSMAGEWFPLQSTWIAADSFFALGGFDPTVTGIEDIDLMRRLTLHGNLAFTTQALAAVSMGAQGSTTNTKAAVELGRAARERLFCHPAFFGRLRQSAHGPYWHGRWVRAYATSAIWNARRRRWSASASRLIWTAYTLILGAGHLGHADFRRALLQAHQGVAFGIGRAAKTHSKRERYV